MGPEMLLRALAERLSAQASANATFTEPPMPPTPRPPYPIPCTPAVSPICCLSLPREVWWWSHTSDTWRCAGASAPSGLPQSSGTTSRPVVWRRSRRPLLLQLLPLALLVKLELRGPSSCAPESEGSRMVCGMASAEDAQLSALALRCRRRAQRAGPAALLGASDGGGGPGSVAGGPSQALPAGERGVAGGLGSSWVEGSLWLGAPALLLLLVQCCWSPASPCGSPTAGEEGWVTPVVGREASEEDGEGRSPRSLGATVDAPESGLLPPAYGGRAGGRYGGRQGSAGAAVQWRKPPCRHKH